MYAAYDNVTGALVIQPQDAAISFQAGRTVFQVPGSAIAGVAVWSAALRGYTDPPAPPVTAYQIAVAAGFVGTQSAWLASLVGSPGAAGITGVTRVVKPADEARANATMADDADLSIAVAASAVYAADILLMIGVSNILADAKWTLTGPSGAVLVASESGILSSVAAFGLTAVRTVLVASVATYLVQARGIITTTGAGNFRLQWAQNTLTAGGPTTLKRGSFIELTRLI